MVGFKRCCTILAHFYRSLTGRIPPKMAKTIRRIDFFVFKFLGANQC